MNDEPEEPAVGLPRFAAAPPALVVLTVHGTNDSDDRDEGPRWWQRQSRFTQRLAHALTLRGIAPVSFEPVHWSGANSDHDRLDGARRVAASVAALNKAGRPYSVVAHSHGGNVAMEGLGSARSLGALSGVISFGTPFFVRRLKLVPAIIAAFQVVLGLTMTPLMIAYFVMLWGYLYRNGLYAKLIEPVMLFGGLGALSLWALVKGSGTLSRRWRSARRLAQGIGASDWLVVHSPRDEAMRLLETAAALSPTYVTSAWGTRSLTRLATFAGLAAVGVFLWKLGGYFTEPLVRKVAEGAFTLATLADLSFLLVLPVVYFAGWFVVWLVARLGGGHLYAWVVNHFISGGLVGAAYGGDGADHLVRVERLPPPLAVVREARIEALNLGGIDDKAIFESAQGVYEEILAGEGGEGGVVDPDRMWKALS
ncbi:MAG: hypothetical protein AB7L18_13860, partial [Hyphomicrobiaceae bacterium]